MLLLRYFDEFASVTIAAASLAIACVFVVKATQSRLIVAGSAAVIAAIILAPLADGVSTHLSPHLPNDDGSLPGPVMSSVVLPGWLIEVVRIGAVAAFALVFATFVQVVRLRRTYRSPEPAHKL